MSLAAIVILIGTIGFYMFQKQKKKEEDPTTGDDKLDQMEIDSYWENQQKYGLDKDRKIYKKYIRPLEIRMAKRREIREGGRSAEKVWSNSNEDKKQSSAQVPTDPENNWSVKHLREERLEVKEEPEERKWERFLDLPDAGGPAKNRMDRLDRERKKKDDDNEKGLEKPKSHKNQAISDNKTIRHKDAVKTSDTNWVFWLYVILFLLIIFSYQMISKITDQTKINTPVVEKNSNVLTITPLVEKNSNALTAEPSSKNCKSKCTSRVSDCIKSRGLTNNSKAKCKRKKNACLQLCDNEAGELEQMNTQAHAALSKPKTNQSSSKATEYLKQLEFIKKESVEMKIDTSKLSSRHSQKFKSGLRDLKMAKVQKRAAPASTGEMGNPDADVLSLYLGLVKSKIDEHWKDPFGGGNGKVKVSFAIFPQGNIAIPKIVKSSGVIKLDNLALRAVKNAAPLPPFPKEIKEPKLSLVFNFVYVPSKN